MPWGSRFDDVGLYAHWGERLLDQAVPYRDFMVEYPPGALGVVLVPAVLAALGLPYAVGFVLWAWAWDVGLRRHLWPYTGGNVLAQWLYTALQLPLYAIFHKRLDVFAAVCAAMALSCLVRRPDGLVPWLLVALGVLIKVYPGVLVPAMVAFAWRRGLRCRAVVFRLAMFAAAILLPLGAMALWAGSESLQWLHYHHDRGLQATSPWVAWHLLHTGLGSSLRYAQRFGALEITEAWSGLWAQRSTAILLLTQGLTGCLMARRIFEEAGLWRMALAHVLAFTVTAKVGSPQYVVWSTALAVCAFGRGARKDWPLIVGIVSLCLMTAQLYPGETLLLMGDTKRQGVLVGRMLAQWALWLYLVWRPNGPPGCALTPADPELKAERGKILCLGASS